MTTPYDVLNRITSRPRAPEPAGERCEMCSEAIADEHQHVVNVAGRQLMCVCRACYLLFTDSDAELRYRAVPDRYLAFPDFALDRLTWEALQIPVGVAFFFTNSELGRTVAFYPGPAGATESELDLDAWNAIAGADPRAGLLADDVEALLLRYPNVVLWVNGHTHRNQVIPHARPSGGGFWEVNTAAHIDFPQQSRIVEIADNRDGTLSVFATILDSAGPASYGGRLADPVHLASLSRELAGNDWQERAEHRRGEAADRNVELLVPAPF